LTQDGSDSMGYFTSTEASGLNNCLFSKFKIFVDVECCPDRIRRTNNDLDSPTMLNYVFSNVNAAVCNGLVTVPACTCAESTCGDQFADPGVCTPVRVITNVYSVGNCSGVPYALGMPTVLGRRLIDYSGTSITASSVSQGRLSCSLPPYALTLYESPCMSGVFELGPTEYIRTWACGDTVYGNKMSDAELDCCDILGFTRCSVIASGSKFDANDTCIWADESVSGESITDPGASWQTLCDCSYKPGSEASCGDGSMIKATITELI